MAVFNDNFDTVLERMNSRVGSSVDKREGSIVYDANASSAFEIEILNRALEYVLKNGNGITADREHLILHSRERNIEIKAPTPAKWKGVFDKNVDIGARFSLDNNDLNFIVESPLSEQYTYLMRCEEAGTIGNLKSGRLIPIDNIPDLKKAEITELIIPGEDEEETEALRQRYIDSFNNKAYGGNIVDYKQKVNSIDGVGGVKVAPVWKGGGTVKVVFITSTYEVPAPDFVAKVQEIIDPVPFNQLGVGIAPIGHYVTVEGAVWDIINIKLNITFFDGYTFENTKDIITSTINEYLTELRKEWGNMKSIQMSKEEPIVIRVSKIESKLLDLQGIKDIGNTAINGVESNYILAQNAIPKLGVIS